MKFRLFLLILSFYSCFSYSEDVDREIDAAYVYRASGPGSHVIQETFKNKRSTTGPQIVSVINASLVGECFRATSRYVHYTRAALEPSSTAFSGQVNGYGYLYSSERKCRINDPKTSEKGYEGRYLSVTYNPQRVCNKGYIRNEAGQCVGKCEFDAGKTVEFLWHSDSHGKAQPPYVCAHSGCVARSNNDGWCASTDEVKPGDRNCMGKFTVTGTPCKKQNPDGNNPFCTTDNCDGTDEYDPENPEPTPDPNPTPDTGGDSGGIPDPSPFPDGHGNGTGEPIDPDGDTDKPTEPDTDKPELEEPKEPDPVETPTPTPKAGDNGDVVKAVTDLNKSVGDRLHAMHTSINRAHRDEFEVFTHLSRAEHQTAKAVKELHSANKVGFQNVTDKLDGIGKGIEGLHGDLEGIGDTLNDIEGTLDGIANTDTSGAGAGGTCIEKGNCKGFYQSAYGDGGIGGAINNSLSGIKDELRNSLSNMFKLDLSNARAPNWIIDLSFLGFGRFSVLDFFAADFVFTFVRFAMMFYTTWTCRRLIFGG